MKRWRASFFDTSLTPVVGFTKRDLPARVVQEPPVQSQQLGELASATMSDVPLLVKWTWDLYCNFAFGLYAYIMFFRLVMFSFLLAPALFHPVKFWLFSPEIHRSVVYGPNKRNRLDIYLPRRDSSTPLPVVINVMGGAWIIGYKAWCTRLGQVMVDNDIILVAVDYRNYPQTTMPGMLDDVSLSIAWVFDNIADMGGDPDKMIIVGQSAGAHLCAYHMLQECSKPNGLQLQRLRAFICVSGPFNMVDLVPNLHRRGFYTSVFDRICDHNIKAYSPLHVLQDLVPEQAAKLPPLYLLHGDEDVTVPPSQSFEFAEALRQKGVRAHLRIIDGYTHSEFIVEGPLKGKELVANVILSIFDSDHWHIQYRPLMPPSLINLGRWIMPF